MFGLDVDPQRWVVVIKCINPIRLSFFLTFDARERLIANVFVDVTKDLKRFHCFGRFCGVGVTRQ